MRTHKMFPIVLACLIGVIVLGTTTPLLGREIEVVFQVSLDQLAKQMPSRLMLYQASPDPQGMPNRQALQHFLGKSAYVEIQDVSGGAFCADLSRLWAKVPRPGEIVRVLSARELQAKASELLGALGWKASEKTQVYNVTDEIEFLDQRGQRQTLPFGYNVTYRRLLEGHEVTGPGGKMKVFFDRSGEVAGCMRVWRKLTPAGEQKLISVQQAADQFKKDPLGRVLLDGVTSVVVTGMKLAYLELGISESQRYLQPTFLFQCTAFVDVGGKAQQIPYVRYMEALVQPPEPLWPGGRSYEPGARLQALPKPGED